MKKITTAFLRTFYKNNPDYNLLRIDYIWETFCNLHSIEPQWKNFHHLKSRCYNFLFFLDYNHRQITKEISTVDTLKFPHTAKLSNAKRKITSFILAEFFQKQVTDYFPDREIILIVFIFFFVGNWQEFK